ncbi:lipase family protein [Nocardia stercoris]|uniref:Lipase n=1 Tax=Nocardia stercoris TaxID=2483361 RepID=A0A3M2L3Z1_9NOCA|nr:lipase family protein [Nocardia stercoris]RMI31430.1 lipase [Nocardia stercoris]
MAFKRTVVHGLAGVLGGLALAVAPTTVPATAEAVYPAPDPDPFYWTPGNIGDYAPGDVIDSRVQPGIPLLPGTTVTLVKFRSNDSHGNPIAATTTVLTPFNHAANTPLISYQAFINGLGPQCAVSHTISGYDPINGVREMPLFNVWLARGFAVALPDHEGPQFALGAGRLGGQITLDGVRAVHRTGSLGLGGSPTVLAGYSAGGLATAWAAALQPAYAPDLQLAGAVVGGVPANLDEMVQRAGPAVDAGFGMAMAAALGLEREYPQMNVSSRLTAAGRQAAAALTNACIGQILASGPGHTVTEYATDTGILSDPAIRGVLQDNSVELYGGAPATPILEWHAPNDEFLPDDAISRTDQHWCAAGNPVLSVRPAIPEHIATFIAGFPGMMAWIEARFDGLPPLSNC